MERKGVNSQKRRAGANRKTSGRRKNPNVRPEHSVRILLEKPQRKQTKQPPAALRKEVTVPRKTGVAKGGGVQKATVQKRSIQKRSVGRPKPLLPARGRLSVVIPAMNEQDTIGQVLSEVRLLQPNEIVVVVNGSNDRTASISRQHGAKVLEYAQPLGNDVGRAVGALNTDADVYLFLDADFSVSARTLTRFITSVEKGTDVALNSLHWIEQYPQPDIPSLDRYFLSVFAGRSNLGVENMLTIPHALSRRAVDVIGAPTLANPLLATAVAMKKGLRMECAAAINVLQKNKWRPNHRRKPGEQIPSAYQRMHGDTVEALRYLLDMGQETGATTRQVVPFQTSKTADASATGVNHLVGVNGTDGYRLMGRGAFVTPVLETETVDSNITVILAVPAWGQDVLVLLRSLAVHQVKVIVIVPDEGNMESIANSLSAEAVLQQVQLIYAAHPTEEALVIGKALSANSTIVFHDTTIPILAETLVAFGTAVVPGQRDVVVNNQIPFKLALGNASFVHLANWFMNVTTGLKQLGPSGLTIPPFALSQAALLALSSETLRNPVRCLVDVSQKGFQVGLGPQVNASALVARGVVSESTFRSYRLPQYAATLDEWTRVLGRRGGFTDEGRMRHLLPSIGGVYDANYVDGLIDKAARKL